MNWQKQLQRAMCTTDELLQKLDIPETQLSISDTASKRFPLIAPEAFIKRIRTGNIADPLLRQILPAKDEEIEPEGFIDDPVGDLKSEKTPGLLHKYRARVLLIVTGACAIHCRYCFRRHFPYSESTMSSANWLQALDYIRSDTSIEEVILSGGDPLTLTDKKLWTISSELAEIKHLQRLRIHSRIPTVLPERILESNLSWFTTTRLSPVLILHINHSQEIDDKVRKAIEKLKQHNIPLYNQSVLLKGINDRSEDLIDLSKTLFELGIIPYYLHLLDPVSGASHFEVCEEDAKDLVCAMRENLPGYLVPTLVREVCGQSSKLPL